MVGGLLCGVCLCAVDTVQNVVDKAVVISCEISYQPADWDRMSYVDMEEFQVLPTVPKAKSIRGIRDGDERTDAVVRERGRLKLTLLCCCARKRADEMGGWSVKPAVHTCALQP